MTENVNESMNAVEVPTYNEGDLLKGTVSQVGEKEVIVQIPNSKMDGIIPISELSPLHIEKPEDVVNVGDELTLMVKKVEEDKLILSKRRADAEKAWEELSAKFESGEYIEAEIHDVVKGGLVVNVGIRGFIPASHVDDHFVEDLSEYKGKSLLLKVIELDKEKNRLILSHREVKKEQNEKKKQEIMSQIQAGDVLEGTVQRITDFGVFVDIGGVDGLVHISQLSHQHVEHPSEVVNVGEQVKVKVLSIDVENERISLSIKETLPGPWEQIKGKVNVGDVLEGTVKRLVSFGAFVEVFPGVEGLVHISQISQKRIGTPHEVLQEGEQVKVKVLSVDEDEKRLSLSIKELEEKAEAEVEDSVELPEETRGFQLGDVIGDQLKKLKL